MDHFQIIDGVLHAENVPLTRIAEDIGTPVYVYSQATLQRHAQVFRDGLINGGVENPHIAFAIKANPNLAVLKVLARRRNEPGVGCGNSAKGRCLFRRR